MMPRPTRMRITIPMIHLRYFVQQSRMSADGASAALILPFRPSFDREPDDSHSFDVDALGSSGLAEADGRVWVDDDAMGSDVSSGAAL